MLLKDKGFLSSFFSLYWSIVLQNVVVLSVNLVDNIMLGAYSESALSGAAAVNQLQFFLQMVINGFGGGLVVLLSQYWAQGRSQPIRRLTAIGLWGGIGVSLALLAACWALPRQLLGLFTTQEDIIGEGVKYLNIIKWTFPIFAAATILQQAFQGVGTVRLALAAALVALALNVALNALLIPRWGVEGAAAATLTARIASLACTWLYAAKWDQKICLRRECLLPLDRELAWDFLRTAAPAIIINGLWGISTGLQTVILGHMEAGTAGTIAANSMATTLYSILKTASVGAASVAAILVGGAVGSGDMDRVKAYAKTLQVMFLAIGVVSSGALFALRWPILSLYRDMRPQTKELANQFLLVLCLTGIGTAYQMPVITGIIRGGGDAKFGMINDLITIWGLVIPLSLLAAFVLKWSPAAVVLCLNADQLIKCIAGAVRVNRYRWIRRLTRPEG
ncbi:MAG TPA: MATE family efflux transporter [Candidatus Excrementavichristensenella intestinipullorum]|nr:MATE family efflux transporter [Candidatus Excrementavichristensenella intestinipullorum]